MSGFSDRPLAERFRLLAEFEQNISRAIVIRQAEGLPIAQDERELVNVRALLTEASRESRRISLLRKHHLSEVPA